VGILMIVRIVQGFLMIELLLTILIIISIVSVGIGYYTKILIIQKDTELYIQATTHASQALERVLAQKSAVPYTKKNGLFTISVQPMYMAENNQFICVEAKVTWDSVLKTSRTISMHSGFARKISA
jgi:Tfp pilus assembly protein PilV